MGASAEMIARVRRMVVEPDETTYTDEAMAVYIEEHPLVDLNGQKPTILGYSEFNEQLGLSLYGSLVPNPYWIATYDLNAAAADIWDEKAAALVANGAIYETDSAHLQAMRQVRHYASRRAVRTTEMKAEYPQWLREIPSL